MANENSTPNSVAKAAQEIAMRRAAHRIRLRPAVAATTVLGVAAFGGAGATAALAALDPGDPGQQSGIVTGQRKSTERTGASTFEPRSFSQLVRSAGSAVAVRAVAPTVIEVEPQPGIQEPLRVATTLTEVIDEPTYDSTLGLRIGQVVKVVTPLYAEPADPTLYSYSDIPSLDAQPGQTFYLFGDVEGDSLNVVSHGGYVAERDFTVSALASYGASNVLHGTSLDYIEPQARLVFSPHLGVDNATNSIGQ